ncbi:MAG: SEC-C domain-containing protein [Gammaproteobacteria bacterium]|uniref:YecA family protein n=1 Tax=Rhodoferax sp. TaxID=50421 RepID=UPI0017BD64AB|nr:SEC-C metal-binding domain-containing protein [Rhodoferax sp.]MBU3898912.1 SEC-C domain-containing protein [Gammaproteobacteria bacterium]MBA3059533.1 hypothetical protein [Rhodoferax sp.]MBU3998160.1 SEC-C domain-containing protein [Gammaproteobacteria bacterium]MBU4019388.1 SEC-C domain-containing protein [Gammaproteobacteria bacterium]MBU4081952.1 SEC-C domain-containing protein [Gammaproteobacteria bacterium]
MNNVKPDPYKPCPCGSGRKYKFCCRALEQVVSDEHPLVLLKKSAQYPLARCVVNDGWQEQGMANVFVVRQLTNGKFLCGVYLVDVLCLGVKDAFFNANLSATAIDTMLNATGMPVVAIDYEDARSLILGSIEFASRHGYKPHRDWETAMPVVEPDKPFNPKFEFGHQGQAIHISGLG